MCEPVTAICTLPSKCSSGTRPAKSGPCYSHRSPFPVRFRQKCLGEGQCPGNCHCSSPGYRTGECYCSLSCCLRPCRPSPVAGRPRLSSRPVPWSWRLVPAVPHAFSSGSSVRVPRLASPCCSPAFPTRSALTLFARLRASCPPFVPGTACPSLPAPLGLHRFAPGCRHFQTGPRPA